MGRTLLSECSVIWSPLALVSQRRRPWRSCCSTELSGRPFSRCSEGDASAAGLPPAAIAGAHAQRVAGGGPPGIVRSDSEFLLVMIGGAQPDADTPGRNMHNDGIAHRAGQR